MAAMTSTIYANDLKLKSDQLDVCRTKCAKFQSNRSSSFVIRVVTDTQTDARTHTHTRLRFLPRDNHNTFSPLKKTECKKERERESEGERKRDSDSDSDTLFSKDKDFRRGLV